MTKRQVKSSAAVLAQRLRTARGFDETYVYTNDGVKYVRVRCSQCASSCVNGVALHEQGCPNERIAR